MTSSDEEFEHAPQVWLRLQDELIGLESVVPGTTQFAKERYDASINCDNPVENAYKSTLFVELPLYGFKVLCGKFPKYRNTYEQYRKNVDELVAAGASVPDAVAQVLSIIGEVENPPPTPTPPKTTPSGAETGPSYAQMTATRPREVGDLAAWEREQVRGYNESQLAKNRDDRSFITMDQAAPSAFERAIVAINRATTPKKSDQSD